MVAEEEEEDDEDVFHEAVLEEVVVQQVDEEDEQVDFGGAGANDVVDDEVVVAIQVINPTDNKKEAKMKRLRKQLSSDLSNYWDATRRTPSRERKQTIFYSP